MFSLLRLLTIILNIFRYGLDGEIAQQNSPLFIRIISYFLPGRYLFARKTRGKRIALFLEKMGPVFIKFGQALSTRPDLLPDDIFRELRKLQDQVQPLNEKQINKLLNTYYQQAPQQLFANLEKTPIASASIAQVHGVTLRSGESAVIKIVRPKIQKQIKRDLSCLRLLASLVEMLHPDGKRIHPKAVVDDYQYVIQNELNLEHEAANTSLLKNNFNNSKDLYVPKIYWELSNKNVLCMERVNGIPVGNIDALSAAGIDFKKLSERAVRIFFTQLLEDNFFHADMHPGNIFVDVSKPQDPSFIALDCAIMGSLEEQEKINIAQLLNAVFSRDYMLAAKLFIRSGWVDPQTSVSDLAGSIRAANEVVFAQPLSEISFATQLMQLFMTGRRYNMQMPTSLVLLQKTLFNIEGLGKQLYPELDLWNTAQPFIQNWLKKYYSPLNIIRRNSQHIPLLIDQAPKLLEAFIAQKQSGDKTNSPSLSQSYPKQVKRFIALSLVAASAIISAYQPHLISEMPLYAWPIAGGALMWLWFS